VSRADLSRLETSNRPASPALGVLGAGGLNDSNDSSPVPAWLVIFVLMLMVIITINPSAEDFAWFRGLRRPPWMSFHIWLPMVWLLIYAGIYFGALRAWEDTTNLLVIACFLALVALVETATWFLCRSHRVGAGALALLGVWGYGAVLALALWRVSPGALPPLLPFLLWTPMESLLIWQLRRINRLP
jgi:benzodiazapine receptor